MPTPHEFSRFLATSLAFTTAIRTIRLFFDDHLLCQLDKKLSPAKPVRPGGHIGLASPRRMMSIRSVDQTSLQIDAKVLPWILRKKPKSKLVATTAKATASATTFAAKMLSAFSTSSSRTSSPSPAPAEIPHADRTSRAELLEPTRASLFLRVVTANVGVSVTSSFSAELERATKKSPPKQTQYSLIWTSKDEWDASRGSSPSSTSSAKVLSGDDSARSVFDGLISDLDAQGRVFIGFATHQTTGCAASVAARFIPTVERESLDLQASHVADWNKELLAIGGTLARIVYDAEIEEVGQLWKQKLAGGKEDEATKQWLIGRCLHAMAFFAFLPSTPSSVVGVEAERQFFGCAPNSSFNLISTQGLQSAWKVRVPNPELSPFIKQIPFVPSSTTADPGHARFIERLKERRLVKDVTFDDVFGELNSRALSLDEMRACLAWFVGLAKMQGYDASLVSRLNSSAMVSFPSGAAADTTIMPLATARTFVNPKTLPTDLPLPLHTLPFELTKTLRMDELVHVFGFSELTVPEWLRRLLELSSVASSPALPVDQNLTLSPTFAESVLNVVARAWGTMGAGQQQDVVGLLKDKTCIPTRHGMTKPDESYHKNVNLFEDLSVVVMPSGKPVSGTMEKLLTGLGVRKHVEVRQQTVAPSNEVDRLARSCKWSFRDCSAAATGLTSSSPATLLRSAKRSAATNGTGSSTRGGSRRPARPRCRSLPGQTASHGANGRSDTLRASCSSPSTA